VAGNRLKKLSAPMLALHRYLRDNWPRETYDGRAGPRVDIGVFGLLAKRLADAAAAQDWTDADAVAGHLEAFGPFLSAYRRYDGWRVHMDNLRGAVAARSVQRVGTHLARLTRIVRPTAADRTFADGERVAIRRTEHGWHGGRLGGTVRPDSGGTVVDGDDGACHEVLHPRDLA
jgi:hypothetical protein